MAAALDPRRKLHRDPFNEMFVFLLSATGAAAIVPMILLIVTAFTDKFEWWIFVVAAVVLELLLIFGLGRPQMKANERVGWSLLWGAAAALLGLAFYYLVIDPVFA